MLNVLAEGGTDAIGLGLAGIGLGLGILVFGAAKGIGNIGAKAVEATARQPEAGNAIFLQMIVSAALIEGFTFFGIIYSGMLATTWKTLWDAAHAMGH